MHPPILFLMGPTASGKTPLAIEIVKRFPCEIISVDSAMVYQSMDIGTAKPDAETLQVAPHRLIDILDPKTPYSAGQFRLDAQREINAIHAQGKVPLLVGGTMLYFRALQQGLAPLPSADPTLRHTLQMRAQELGWPALHAALTGIDPSAASCIDKQDGQRIQRALEIYYLTGKTKTTFLQEQAAEKAIAPTLKPTLTMALMPTNRAHLHQQIELRFDNMLEKGFLAEVSQLYQRGDLTPDLPAIRSVGYREAWRYLAGEIDFNLMREQVLASTRQLAKRQMTWLRAWEDMVAFDPELEGTNDAVFHHIANVINKVSSMRAQRSNPWS